MKVLAWCVRIALFLLVITFSVRNTETVVVNWLPGIQMQAPLVLALLFAFLVGAVFAWVLLLPSWLKAKRSATVANKALARAEQNLTAKQINQTVTPEEEVLMTLPVGPSHGI